MSDLCVLAYSGGLDTSVAARALREERGLDVVAAFVDLGQPHDPVEVAARASAARADLRVIDARKAFAEGFCLPALHANALYEGKYPLVSALARPLIAAEVVRVAREVGAGAVAHGCTGKGNDQVRFETSFAALAPDLRVIAPVREDSRSREESLQLAERWGIPQAAEAKTYSVDENLWGRTVEAGNLEDPWAEPPAGAFALTTDPLQAPEEPAEVTLAFEAGRPVALDGVRLDLVGLVAKLTGVVGTHGFGRVDMVENRLVGIKSRELYEVPAALAFILAHRELEDLTLERDLAHEKAALERRWAELCYYGQWYGPLHRSLRAFMAAAQEHVSGEVRLRFFKGGCTVVGRRSARSLYDYSLATYERSGDRFDHRQAAGFISLWSLPIKIWAGRDAAVGVEAAPKAVRSKGRTSRAAAKPTEEAGTRDETPGPVWASRFAAPPAEESFAFTASARFDRRLVAQDLRATKAHAEALARAGLIGDEQRDHLGAELRRLQEAAAAGTFPFDDADEDVHVAVERVLTDRLGALGARIHAGRSRNDLVVTDLRLWVMEAAGELAAATRGLAAVLAGRAEEHMGTLLPGYTHLQRGQPVSLAHHLLAHAFPLARDAERFERAATSADASALGAGALATSTLQLDPGETARSLGFSRAFGNSIDAVADRDFALDFLAACVTTAVHVSRLAEDLVLWSTEEFGFARPADADATGSSMMPQKRNPDVAELARAKVGRVLGNLVGLVTVMKGLPLSYNRDLQEDKEALFDARDALVPALEAMSGLIRRIEFDGDRMHAAAGDGSLLATDLAEHLVAEGVPFREAYGLVGRIVRRLEAEGRTLADLKPDEWKELDARLGPEVADLMSARASVARRRTAGGPSVESVRRQLDDLGAALAGPARTRG